MDSSKNIKCPIITVWFLFTFNFFFNYFNVFFLGSNSHSKKGIYDFYMSLSEGYIKFAFFSLIINCVIELIASIIVTYSFKTKKNLLYIIGLIISIIFDICMTTYIIIIFKEQYYYLFGRFENIPDFYKNNKNIVRYKRKFIFNMISHIVIQWSQPGVLIAYYNKVKTSFDQPDLSPVLINDYDCPSQITPTENGETPTTEGETLI